MHLTNIPTYEAGTDANLANVELMFRPRDLMDVGYASIVYSHTIPKEAEMANFPIIANVKTNQFVSAKSRHVFKCDYLLFEMRSRP